MDRKHRLGFSWLAVVLCMALLMTGMPFATAFAKGKDKKETYTIKWKVNGEVVREDRVKKGQKPEKPQDPADYSDGKYTYVFSGWEPKVGKANKDMTYKAKFKKTERKFIITWLDDKGQLIDFTEVKYGKLPTHEDPKKKASEKYTYTFDGWEPELVKAKEDATYTATFKKEARKYKITWLDDEGNVIEQTKVAYGKLPTHEDPVKKSGKTAYTFTGWEPELTEVTGEATYTATFEKSSFYTVTWLDDEGNVIDTTEVEPGKKPTHDDPTKEASAEYTYTFAGWTPKIVKAKGDATYTATFKQKVRKYTVTWLDDEGNVLDETKVAYGEMPTHADPSMEDTENHSYVFRGWEPALTEVTGDASYTAVFDEIPKQPQQTTYTITWLDDEGDVIDTTTVQEGELPTHADPQRPDADGHSYTFVGWDPEPVPAKADASYTAVFTETINEETVPETQNPDEAVGNSVEIIFKYLDETVIDFPQKYVETDEPVQVYYTGTEPVMAADANYAYVWTGWTDDKANPTVALYGRSRNAEEIPLLPVVTKDSPAETVYYAVFQPIPLYTITWIKNDGSAPETTMVAEGEKPTHEDPVVAGYTFDGWVPASGGAPVPTADLPPATANETYTAQYTANPNLFDITWMIDGIPEIVPFVAGAQPTHATPAKAGYDFAGWADAQGTLYQPHELPVVTAAATYTAQWKKALKLDDVYCYAYIKTGDDKETAVKTLLPKSATLDDGTVAELDWKQYKLEKYADAKNGVMNDGTYTYVWEGPVTDAGNNTYILVATCNLIVGPKQSETVGLDAEEKENKKYTYRWDSIVSDARVAKAIITAWDGGSEDKKKAELTIASIIDGMEVTAIEKEAFKGKKVKTIIVPDGVTAIEQGAFDNCANLTDLTLPDSLTSIGMAITEGCKKLKNKKLSVALETRMGEGEDGNYTIEHVIDDETDPKNPVYSQTVTLPEGFPTEIEVTDTGDLTLEITWLDDTGAVADITYVDYGAIPSHKPLTKEKATWKGWDPEPKEVYRPTTYKATYTSDVGPFTVIFLDEDGKTELWRKEDYKYDDKLVYGGDPPTKKAEGGHSYIFEGWVASDGTLYKVGTDLPNVTADATYTAQYMEGTAVELEAKYTGDTLTKVYDCNKYGAYTKDGQTVYVIEALKTIKSKFELNPVKGSEWLNDHKNVGFRLTLSKQFDSADVGSYEFEFKIALTGDDAAYYKLKDPVVKVPAAITSREVVITPHAGSQKVYGTSDPVYKEGTWLHPDESSLLHQDLSGVPVYGVPVNSVDGNPQVTVEDRTKEEVEKGITRGYYLGLQATLNGTKFFPGENPWLTRESGEDAGKYKILIGGMNFGKNFTTTLKDEVFTITPKNIAEDNVIVNSIPDQKYTGNEIKLDKDKLVVKYGDKTLVENTDFTTEYKDNKEPTTATKLATVTLTGKGNYTGTREVTFKIIKTSDSGGGSSGGGSSSSGYGGFDDDDEEEEVEEDEEGDANWTPSPNGNIKLEEMDYGTVLFGADGKPRPFSQYEEEYEPETEDADDEEEFEDFGEEDDALEVDDEDAEDEAQTTLRRVYIKADWMKETDEAGQEQDVLLEGTNRKRYEELHLRLTNSVVQGLINNGVGEIVYELEQAQLRLPLSALPGVITLPADEAAEGADATDDGFDVDDEIEIEGDDETVELESTGDIADEPAIPAETGVEVKTLPVDGYDIVIEQADAAGLSQRETELIADNRTLMPAYRLRAHIIPENAQQTPTGEMDENQLPITVPVTETLPEGYTLPGVALLLAPDENYEFAPEEAQLLYASPEVQVDEAVDESAEVAAEPAENAEATESDAEATEIDAVPADPSVGELMVANNPALASAIDSGVARLEPAVFNEVETPIKVEVQPVVDGLYVTLVPADWDPTPYLAEPEEATSDDEGDFDEADEDEFEEAEDNQEIEFEDEEEEEFVEF